MEKKTRQYSAETDNRWGPEDCEQTKVAFESRTLCKFIWKWQWYLVSVKTPFLFPFKILSTNSFSLDIFCFSPILSHKISHNELILQIWFKNFVMKDENQNKMKFQWCKMPSFSFSPFPELRSSHSTGGHIGIQDIYTCPEELHRLPPMNVTLDTLFPSHNHIFLLKKPSCQ